MTEKEAQQHVVLCEGFDDRSFWAGWLQYLGCTDPSDRGKVAVKDAWGRQVAGGRFLFRTPAGSRVIVHPFQGRTNARQAAFEYLRGQVYRPDRLIVNLDSDAANGSGDSARDVVRGIVRDHGGDVSDDGNGVFEVDGVQVCWVIWECDDPKTPGVPLQQTLERLITASLQAAYPDRGPVVDDWLAAEPRAERTNHKNYGYSYLAKWYAEHGADDFFRAVWRDDSVAAQLYERLEKTGAWPAVANLVGD